jgi:hypothetical protein
MELCPCGSQKDYVDCCQPLIKGERTADTAEALMRSRYTAHAKKEFDYLFETTHPSAARMTTGKGQRPGPESWTGSGWKFAIRKRAGRTIRRGRLSSWPATAKTARRSITMKLLNLSAKTAAGILRTARRRSRCRLFARARKSEGTIRAPAAAARSIRNAAGSNRKRRDRGRMSKTISPRLRSRGGGACFRQFEVFVVSTG